MAEVKRGNGIPTLPLKKPASFNHSSSSYKHIYDDIFASPIQSRQQSPSFIEDDYAEMFGSSRSNSGTWSISYSSIPVLDLPPPSEMRVRGASGVKTVSGERRGEVDYSGVFGGFGDGSFGLPDGEELFDQFNKKTKTSSNVTPRSKVQKLETTRPEIVRQTQPPLSPEKVPPYSSDSLQNFERKKNEAAVKNSGEITKPPHAHCIPVAAHKMEETVSIETTMSRNIPVIKDRILVGKDVYVAKKQGKHDRHTSVDLGANESELSASNSSDAAHHTSQSAEESANIFSQPSDSTNHFDNLNNMCSTGTSEPIYSTNVNAVHESTPKLHKLDPAPNNLSGETSVLNFDTETKIEANNGEKQGRHSRNPSSEFKAGKHNSELHAEFQNVPTTSEPVSRNEPQDAHQPNLEGGLSKTDSGDFSITFDGKRKKGRHSRITSLDLKDRKPSIEQDEQLHRKPRFGSSYSFDASHDPHTAHVKVHPSMVAPSSSVPQFFPVESHYKISENSTWRNFGADLYKGSTVSSPSFEEQLDMDSDAALSAVALQRAIEEASMIIQMAKEYVERESQGSSKARFKDTLKVKAELVDQVEDEIDCEIFPLANTDKQNLPFLKETVEVKVAKDNQVVDEINGFQETMVPEIGTPVFDEIERYSLSERRSVLANGHPSPVCEDQEEVFKEPVVRNEKKFAVGEGCIEDNMMHDNIRPVESEKESFLTPKRSSEFETGEPSPIVNYDSIFQDKKGFVHDKGFTEERNPSMLNLIDERDKEEGGGEWEAAKHLNQLICGVKNKIASFMTWQSDMDKKENPRDTEASRRSHLQFEENEPDLVDVQKTEIISAEENEVDIGYHEEHVEMEIGFLSETVEPYENESFCTVGLEKADDSVALNPNVGSVNFIFCPFRNEGVRGSTEPDEEVNNVSEERMDIEVTSVTEEMLNEAKYEQLPDKLEDQNREAADDSCTTLDSVTSVREEMLNVMMYEQLPGKCEQQNRDVLDDSCTIVDRFEQEIIAEETDEIMEEPYFVSEKKRNELTDDDISIRSLDEECREDLRSDSHCPEVTTEKIEEKNMCEDSGVIKETENWQHDAQIIEETDLNGHIGKIQRDLSQTDHIEEVADQTQGGDESITDQDGKLERELCQTDHFEDVAEQMNGGKEFITDDYGRIDEDAAGKASFVVIDKDVFVQTESSSIEVVSEEMAEEASAVPAAEFEHAKTENKQIADDCQQTDNECFSESEGSCIMDDSSVGPEEALSSDESSDMTMEIPNPSSDPQLKKEETVLFYDSFVELDEVIEDVDDRKTLQFENSVLHGSQSDENPGTDEINADKMEGESRDILGSQIRHLPDSKETLDVGKVNTINDQEVEMCGVESVQRRRRWFDNGVKVGSAERPSILEGDISEVETDQESLDASVLTGSVEVHAGELDSDGQEVIYSKEHDIDVNQGSGGVNPESTPKRRRWSVKIGEEGLPVPPPLFRGNDVNLEELQKNEIEPMQHSKSESSLHKLNAESEESINATVADVAVNGEKDKKGVEAPPRRKRWFGIGENVGPVSQLRNSEDAEIKPNEIENQKRGSMPTMHEMEVDSSKVEPVNDRHLDEVDKKEKEKEKERIVVERAIREARERAFVEAKERARRDASERPNVKVAPGAQERAGKVPFEARTSSDKASIDAKLKAERAAVERATSEARERALQKAVSEKAFHKSREQTGRFTADKNSSSDPSVQSSSSSSRVDLSNKGEKYDGADSESAQRRKARSERQSRERPATAFEEKNRRDLLVQKEQAAKNMMADSLDAELKKWSSGKEGNLRMLLSTLQYILGPESGWQAVSLTDLVAATAVRKAYKKASLCVHPDKLQQRGATIQQKYICEKVYELLKDAFSKLSPDDR